MERFGRYELEKLIGRGGMAEVFRARYSPTPGFSKTLVIKRILPHLTVHQQFVNMFSDEASVTAQLSHSNIVQVFDFGEIDGLYFIAMEYVRGPNLRELLVQLRRTDQHVPIEVATFVAMQVARGLSYAHDAADDRGRPLNIIHRDMNPPNILLSMRGDVKITDFGIAKTEIQIEQTVPGSFKGKVRYAPPESLRSEPVDYRADLWGLGCTLYETLTGSHPYPDRPGDVDTDVLQRILQDPVPPMSDLRTGIPEPVNRVVDLLLRKRADERPNNAGEVAMILSAITPPTAQARLAEVVREQFAEEKQRASEFTPSPATAEDFAVKETAARRREETRIISRDSHEPSESERSTAEAEVIELRDVVPENERPTKEQTAITNSTAPVPREPDRTNVSVPDRAPVAVGIPPVEIGEGTTGEFIDLPSYSMRPQPDPIDETGDMLAPALKGKRRPVLFLFRLVGLTCAVGLGLSAGAVAAWYLGGQGPIAIPRDIAIQITNIRSRFDVADATPEDSSTPTTPATTQSSTPALGRTEMGWLHLQTVQKAALVVDGERQTQSAWIHRVQIQQGNHVVELLSEDGALRCSFDITVAAEPRQQKVDLSACPN